MGSDRKQQEQWQAHTKDEEHAIARQQASAGPTHEPVGESVGQRLQSATDSAEVIERERCIAIVRAWREPARLSALLGPASAETLSALSRALEAVEAELRGGDAP